MFASLLKSDKKIFQSLTLFDCSEMRCQEDKEKKMKGNLKPFFLHYFGAKNTRKQPKQATIILLNLVFHSLGNPMTKKNAKPHGAVFLNCFSE